MKFYFIPLITILLFILLLLSGGESPALINQENSRHSCTIGVASGSATEDGRPLLWKTRDWINHNNTRIYYSDDGRYNVLKITIQGADWPVMGVNEKGFALAFSLSDDLRAGNGHSSMYFMNLGLANCATVDEFEQILDSTNAIGRGTQNNFAAIDSTGAAKIFEVAGSEYWTYDANDTLVAPNGFLVRTNFSPEHGGRSQLGIERYRRSNVLCRSFVSGDSMNYRNLIRYHMRDFARPNGDPVVIPYPDTTLYYPLVPVGGYPCGHTIANFMSEATAVIQGVLPDESPALSTMWAILGMPATSIAVPYWTVGEPPEQAAGMEENGLPYWARQIRLEVLHFFAVWVEGIHLQYIDTYDLRDGNGGGIWPIIYSAEDSFFHTTDSLMGIWRENDVDSAAMLDLSSSLAETGVEVLQNAYDHLTELEIAPESQLSPQQFVVSQSYPNPFNSSTTIRYGLPIRSEVSIRVYDLSGRQVGLLYSGRLEAGWHETVWDANSMSAGVYFVNLVTSDAVLTQKIVLMK